MSATGSRCGPPGAARGCRRMSAPMRRSSSMRPVRVGFTPTLTRVSGRSAARHPATRKNAARSEEHTSELQSQSNLVCRLLLEKKKQHEQLNEAVDVNI